MSYLALDKLTGDLIKKPDGGVERVEEGRFVIQQVQSRLRTFLGEWLPDKGIGFINLSNFVKNYDRYALEAKAVEIIVTTQGVRRITRIELTEIKRVVTINFEAETDYGNIELTVPWG